jgi:hypothetical protein
LKQALVIGGSSIIDIFLFTNVAGAGRAGLGFLVFGETTAIDYSLLVVFGLGRWHCATMVCLAASNCCVFSFLWD